MSNQKEDTMRFRSIHISSLVIAILLLAASCTSTAPSPSDGELAATAAMQTLTAMGIFSTPEPIQPILSSTPSPTDTETLPTASPTWTPPMRTPTPTEDPQACTDLVTYGSDIDVSIPDGTEILPGASFEKIWRISNGGTCTWTTAYKLVFNHGDQMDGPSIQALPGIVEPNASVDLTIQLTSPSTPGTYQGFWKLRNDEGVYVKGPTGNDLRLWVEIVVPEP
ncbi:MAG TPA: hypothetical protein G4O08_08465 [Anaerolineae bacterium]|nr:hypothetical protein [Anaerolineae bacterium]